MFQSTDVQSSSVKLSSVFSLGHKVKFFIPSTIDTSRVAETDLVESMVKFIASELAVKFGGATVEPIVHGYWMSDAIGLVEEGITPIFAFFGQDVDEVESWIVDRAIFIKSEMVQESVLVEIDGIGYLI